jgi:PAT family beta-lactamase induction signal transducer AmpG
LGWLESGLAKNMLMATGATLAAMAVLLGALLDYRSLQRR